MKARPQRSPASSTADATVKRAKRTRESTRAAGPAARKNGADSTKPARPVVLDVLRQRIATHVLAPGSRLRENELAEEFGVSRARIREAFGALEERGLIVRIANRGAMVTRVDFKQVFEIFDVRERLEGLCAREAATKAPDGGWDEIRARFGAELEREIAAGNYGAYLEARIALQKQIIRFADNATAQNMLDLVYDKAQVIARRVVILPGRAEVGLRLHQDLLGALQNREPDRAEEIMRAIIAGAREQVSRYKEFIL